LCKIDEQGDQLQVGRVMNEEAQIERNSKWAFRVLK
jgi:hypothetical protein